MTYLEQRQAIPINAPDFYQKLEAAWVDYATYAKARVAELDSASGTATIADVTGTATSSQAQTSSATGALATGVVGDATSSQAQTSGATGEVTGTEIPVPRGGGIDHQIKRRKATLEDKPNQHLDLIIAKSFKQVFGKLTDKKAPKEVQKKANKIVSDYSTEYRPTVNQVDWAEFNRDLEAVQRLFALYNKEFAENQKAISDKLLADMIEEDNLEFLLMH